MLIDPHKATLLVVDIQEKLIGAMSDAEGTRARARWLLAATAELELPVVISEQYPKVWATPWPSCWRWHRPPRWWRKAIFPALPPNACPTA